LSCRGRDSIEAMEARVVDSLCLLSSLVLMKGMESRSLGFCSLWLGILARLLFSLFSLSLSS
jgi:hypothetical protein